MWYVTCTGLGVENGGGSFICFVQAQAPKARHPIAEPMVGPMARALVWGANSQTADFERAHLDVWRYRGSGVCRCVREVLSSWLDAVWV